MTKVIEKGTTFALYLKNYLVADIRTRYIYGLVFIKIVSTVLELELHILIKFIVLLQLL